MSRIFIKCCCLWILYQRKLEFMMETFVQFIQENLKLSIFIGSGVLFYTVESFFPFKEHLESRWRHIGRNLLIALVNLIFYGIIFGIAVSWVLEFTAIHQLGFFRIFSLGYWPELILTVIALDAVIYLWHVLLHRVPFLWKFHLVHHADSRLDFSSGTRFHLGEMICSMLFHLPWYFLLGVSIDGLLASQAFLIFFTQFQHTNALFPQWLDDKIRLVFITSNVHQVHHSEVPKEYNSNYGTIFSFWDRLGKTFNHQKDLLSMRTGLRGFIDNPSFSQNMRLPFDLTAAQKPVREKDH